MKIQQPSFRQLFASARATLAYKVERTIITFTEQVIGKMEIAGLSRTALAEKLEASPSYVTKFLRGGTNFTLESMIKVGEALDCDLKVELVSKSSPHDWFNKMENSYRVERTTFEIWSRAKQISPGRSGDITHVKTLVMPEIYEGG
jgi:transcriptional regulator with XRE-family HTH domain